MSSHITEYNDKYGYENRTLFLHLPYIRRIEIVDILNTLEPLEYLIIYFQA